MSTLQQRKQVLGLYRQILKLSKTWRIVSERAGIANEAKNLFRKNMNITSSEAIDSKIFEARKKQRQHL